MPVDPLLLSEIRPELMPSVAAAPGAGGAPDVRALLARRRAGHSLEAPFYLDRAVFDLDMDAIFGRHWVFVAVEPDVPEPGDTLMVDVGRNSVVIVRDDDMMIRAYHNVCRHRGARLVNAERGSVGNLVCPYHQWTYNLAGELLFSEHMGQGFDRCRHNLKPVHVKSLAGLLFVCFADEPPADFDAMAAVIEPYLAPHALRDAKVAKQIDLVEEGNWKLTMENNRECYHCGVNHPELTQSLFAYGFGFAPEELDEGRRAEVEAYDRLVERHEAEWADLGLPFALVEHMDDRTTSFRAQRLILDEAGESQTLDSRVACRRLLGDLTSPRLGGLSFWTQPNSWHHFMSDHVVTFSVLPLSPERTLLRTKWLVHKDAVEGVDYDLANLTGVWAATNEQDGALVGMTHKGVRSPAYEPGPYSPHTEDLVEKFCRWYVGRLRDHLAA